LTILDILLFILVEIWTFKGTESVSRELQWS